MTHLYSNLLYKMCQDFVGTLYIYYNLVSGLRPKYGTCTYFVGRLSVTGKETEPLTGPQRIAADMVYRFHILTVIEVQRRHLVRFFRLKNIKKYYVCVSRT